MQGSPQHASIRPWKLGYTANYCSRKWCNSKTLRSRRSRMQERRRTLSSRETVRRAAPFDDASYLTLEALFDLELT